MLIDIYLNRKNVEVTYITHWYKVNTRYNKDLIENNSLKDYSLM